MKFNSFGSLNSLHDIINENDIQLHFLSPNLSKRGRIVGNGLNDMSRVYKMTKSTFFSTDKQKHEKIYNMECDSSSITNWEAAEVLVWFEGFNLEKGRMRQKFGICLPTYPAGETLERRLMSEQHSPAYPKTHGLDFKWVWILNQNYFWKGQKSYNAKCSTYRNGDKC